MDRDFLAKGAALLLYSLVIMYPVAPHETLVIGIVLLVLLWIGLQPKRPR